MSMQNLIEQKLQDAMQPEYLEVLNESHMHSGPATESHFRLSIVSSLFNGVRPVQRHQTIYAILNKELTSGVHALALHTYTQEEWLQAGNKIPESPNCRGGTKQTAP